jgi:signal transduction histidine kinase
MQSDHSRGSTPAAENARPGFFTRVLRQLPRGNTLSDAQWAHRHRLLQYVLLGHIPLLAAIGWYLGNDPLRIAYTLIAPAILVALGQFVGNRRLRSFFTTGGFVFCSAGLVVLSSGAIEAHFHFFIIIGFIALYQDWVPFLWNVAFTVISHGIGTIWLGNLIFNTAAGQANPWLWSGIHGIAVLAACVAMVMFWRITEDEQTEKETLGKQLVIADAEIGHRRFTSSMLVNLARRNQSMLHRQLDIINALEEKERDPDALAELFRLDHLATRVRRNAESLLVLAGEQPPRMWSSPVPLRDVVRAAIAETEDMSRVVFAVDDQVQVAGRCVADLTHLLAELIENAVRFSPPDSSVTVRARADLRQEGGHLLTVEDWGVGMPVADLADANAQLATPHEVDLAVSQRLGLHVVARLAARHGIRVSLGPTPGSGITAIVAVPPALFATEPATPSAVPQDIAVPRPYVGGRKAPTAAVASSGSIVAPERTGWIEPVSMADPLPERRPQPLPERRPEPITAEYPRIAPSPVPGFVPFGVAPADRDDWGGWWNGPVEEPVPVPVEPVPVPAPRGVSDLAPEAHDGRPTLRRRVPQSHLAPELRVDQEVAPVPDAPVPHPTAASALSRYQASRQAAQALTEREDDRP